MIIWRDFRMRDDYGHTVNSLVNTINLEAWFDRDVLSVGIVAHPEFFNNDQFPKLIDVIANQWLNASDYDEDKVIVVRSNDKLHGLPVRSNPIYSAELLLCHTPLRSVVECNTVYDCIAVGNASIFGMTYDTFIESVHENNDNCKLESACDLWLFVNEVGIIDDAVSSQVYV